MMQLQNTNMIARVRRSVVIQQNDPVNHCLHFCITLYFFPWIVVWVCLTMMQPSQTEIIVAQQMEIVDEKRPVNHLLHLCITINFPPWIIVWVCLIIGDRM
ncbi:uncharacterized protein LOC124130584 [Haliotis rufescens]|uniref:uncharacterized protein LOC124130584 n=1 Tax=Haliotis rufescens TaxID=6454 RepID=UPI001EAFB895|nr:uncharacterized protein LOC124130584 [Haliotis rufescens]XP_046349645.1 uncharacterized protein LOC124130584 [Haliotis rufescens]